METKEYIIIGVDAALKNKFDNSIIIEVKLSKQNRLFNYDNRRSKKNRR